MKLQPKKMIIKRLLIPILYVCILFSCSKTSYIEPSQESISFAIQGGELLDTIRADGEWEVGIAPQWVKVEIQDSILKCSVDEN